MSGPVAALLIVLLVVALAALALLAWSLIALMRSVALLMEAFLKQSQGLQALAKLKDNEDDKLRAIIAKFGEKPATPNMAKQIDEIRKKAERQGFTVDTAPAQPNGREFSTPMTPPPEPDWDGFVIE